MKMSFVIPGYCSAKTIESVVQEIKEKVFEMRIYDLAPDNPF